MEHQISLVSPKNWLRRAAGSPWILGMVIFGLAIVPRLLDLAVFVGPDEFNWDNRSANFAQALATGNLSETYQDGHPGVTLMWVETVGAWARYGVQSLNGSADWATVIGPDNSSMVNLGSKRQTLAIANAILVVAVVLLVRPVFGMGTAWITGFLVAFDPFLLTESRVLRSEGIMTGFSTLALLCLLLYTHKQQSRYAFLAGILTGLALLSKVSAVALLPVAVLVTGILPLFNSHRTLAERWRAAILALSLFGGAAFLTGVLFWPALWVAPIDVVTKMYNYVGVRVTEGNSGGHSFFLGRPQFQEELSLLYYPFVILYRTTPLIWLGSVLLVAAMWPMRRLSRRQRTLIGIILLYLAIYLGLISSSAIKFDRYIVPMLPTLNILAALGLVSAWQWFVEQRAQLRRLQWLPALLVLIIQIAGSLPYHPYYYTYWNPLLGGLKQAVRVLPVGTGYEGLNQAADYLNTLPDSDTIRVASGNSQRIHPLLKGQTIALDNLDGKWVQADYVLLYISQIQRERHAEDILSYLARHKPEYTLTLHGLDYAWIYPGPAAQFYGGGDKLEGRGTLFGYDLSATELRASEIFTTTLYWRNEGQGPDDRFFVRLMDLDGYTWAEGLAEPNLGFEEANRTENSIVESTATLTLPAGMPPGDYFFKPGFRTVKGKIIGYFELPGDTKPIIVSLANRYPSWQSYRPPHPTRLSINDDLTLLGYDLEPGLIPPGSTVWITLYWRALIDITHDYVILLRLLDEEDQESAYWLGRPVRSGYPTTEWHSQQIVQDPWLLSVPPEVSGDTCCRLEIAVFDADTEAEVKRQILGPLTIGE